MCVQAKVIVCFVEANLYTHASFKINNPNIRMFSGSCTLLEYFHFMLLYTFTPQHFRGKYF